MMILQSVSSDLSLQSMALSHLDVRSGKYQLGTGNNTNNIRFAEAKLRERCSLIPNSLPCCGGTHSVCEQNFTKLVNKYADSTNKYCKVWKRYRIIPLFY